MEPPEPDHKFVEIVKVGRDYHWSSDVTIYYKSEARKFKVEGGCKLKENSTADFREVWIAMANGRHTFKVTRFKTGVYWVDEGYWMSGPKLVRF